MPGLSDLLRNPRRLQQFASTPGNYPAALDYASQGRVDRRAAPRASQSQDKETGVLETGEVIDKVKLPDGTYVRPATESGQLVKAPGKSNLYLDPASGEPYQADPSQPGGLRSAWTTARRTAREGKEYATIPGVGEREIGPDPKAQEEAAKLARKREAENKRLAFAREKRPYNIDRVTGEPIALQSDEEWQKQRADKQAKLDEAARIKKLKAQADRLDLDAEEIKLTAPKIAKEDEDAYSAAEAALAEFAKGESLDTAAERLAAQPDTGDEAAAQAKAAATAYLGMRDKVRPAKEAEAKVKELNLRALDLKKQMLDPEAWKAEKAASLPAMDDASLAAEAKAQAEIITEQEADANDTITKIQEGRQKIADELDAFMTLRQQKEAVGITAQEMQALDDQQAQMEATLADYDDWHAEAAGEAQASLKAAGDRREVLAATVQEHQRRDSAWARPLEGKWGEQQKAILSAAEAAGLPKPSARNGESPSRALMAEAFGRLDKLGIKQPRFIGQADEPAGDRTAGKDLESLLAGLDKAEQQSTTPEQKAAIAKEKAYWQAEAKDAMTAEEWKTQTGEPDLQYPQERAETMGKARDLYSWAKDNFHYTDDYRGMEDYGILDAEAKKRGIDPAQAREALQYFRQLDWSNEHRDPGTGKPLDETARVLPDGNVTVNPALLLDPEAYDAAVDATETSDEAKKRAKLMRADLAEPVAAEAVKNLRKNSDFADWLDKNTSGTDLERMEKFNAEMKAGGALNAALMKFFGSAASLPSGWLGAVAGLTGSDKALEYARYWQDRAQAYQTAAGEAGKGTNMAGRFMASVAGGIPSVMESMAVGGVAGRVLGSGAAALGTAAVDAAAQSGGGTFVEAVDAYMKQGLPEEEAKAKAAAPALASSLVTGVLTALGGGGVESLLRRDGQELAKAAIKRGLKSMIGREVAEGATEESFEEWSDQMLQGVIAQLSYDPNKSLEQVFTEATEAGLVGGVLGGGASGIRAFANRNAPTEGSQPYTPEGPAPAPEEGPAPAMPTQPRAAVRGDVGKIISAFTPTGVPMPQAVNDTIKRTGRAPDQVAKAAVSGLTKVAQGATLEGLDAREREALGFINKDGKIVPAPKTTPLVEIYKDKLVIRNEAAEWLDDEGQPALARQIKLDEAARKAQIDEAAAKPAKKKAGQAAPKAAESTPQAGLPAKSAGSLPAEKGSIPLPATISGATEPPKSSQTITGSNAEMAAEMPVPGAATEPSPGEAPTPPAPAPQAAPEPEPAAGGGLTPAQAEQEPALTPAQADQMARAKADYESAMRLANADPSPEIREKLKKAAGMKYAAAKRQITGKLTGKETEAKAKREASNYEGKAVSVKGRNAVVTGTAFGKVKVKFDDGTKATVPAAEVQPPAPATVEAQPQTYLDRVLDAAIKDQTLGEITIPIPEKNQTRESINKAIQVIEQRGLTVSTDGRFLIVRGLRDVRQAPAAVDEAAQEAATSPAAEAQAGPAEVPAQAKPPEQMTPEGLELRSGDSSRAIIRAGTADEAAARVSWAEQNGVTEITVSYSASTTPSGRKMVESELGKSGWIKKSDYDKYHSWSAPSPAPASQETASQPEAQPAAEAKDEALKVIDAAIRRYEERSRPYEGGQGLPVGAENANDRIAADALMSMKRAVREGKDIDEALKIAIADAHEMVRNHNRRRPKDMNWQRWEGTADSILTMTAGQAKRAMAGRAQAEPVPESQTPPSPTPATEPETAGQSLAQAVKEVAQLATPLARAQAALAAYQAKAVEARKQAQAAGDEVAETLAVKKYGLERILRKRLEAMSGVIDIDLIDPQNVDDVLLIEPKGPTGGILRVNIEGLLDRMAKLPPAKGKQALDTYIFHEFIHRAAIAKMSSSKIERLYNAITPEAKEASRKLYFLGGKDPDQQFNTDFQAAHEWFAQVVEARLRGKVSNQEELEASSDPTLLQQLAALFRDFVAQLRDIAGLVKDPAMAEQIRAEADAVQAAAEAMAAKAGLDVQSKDKAAFYISEIRATNNGQSVFEVGVDKDGDGRSERELRRSFRTLAEAVAYGESYNIRNATPKPWALIGNTHVTRKEDANITIQGKPGEYEVVSGDYTRKFPTLKAVRDYLNTRIFEGSDAYADQIEKLQVNDVAEMRAEYDTADIFTLKAEAKKAGLELDKKATKAEVIEALLNQMAQAKASKPAKAGLQVKAEEAEQAAPSQPGQAVSSQPAAQQADPTLWADVSRFFASMNSDSSRSAAIKDLKNGTATEDSNGYLIDLLENPNWTGNARSIAPKLIARLKATMGQSAAQAQPEPSPAQAVPPAGEAEAPALPAAEPYASPLAQFVGEWLGMNASQQSRVDMPQRVIRLAVNQADTEAVMALVQKAGTKGADGQLLFNTPHQRIYNELREALRYTLRKGMGTEKDKVSTQLTAVPAAAETPALPPTQAAAVAKEEAMPEPAKQAAPFDSAAAKGQKKFLLAEVAAAVKAAPRRAEMTQEQKDTINLLESLPNEWERASSRAEEESVRLRLAATKADAERLIGYITIEVPGDGTFTILNEKGALAQFQKRADKFPVSAIRDDLPSKPTAQAPTAVPALKKPKTTADVVAAIYPMVSEDTTRGAAINNVTGDGTHLFAIDGRVLVRVEQENGGGKGREIALYDEKGVAKPLPDDERPYDGNQVIPDDKDFTPYTLDTGRWFSLMSQARAVLKTLPGEDDSQYKSASLYRNPDGSLGVFASDVNRGDYAHNIQPEAKFLAAYNPEYIQTILRVARNLGQEQVEMRIQDDVTPATFRAGPALFVLMPMRVNGAPAYSPQALAARPAPPVTAQARPAETALEKALKEADAIMAKEMPGTTPESRALRREADALAKQSRKVMEGIPAGQPVLSTRDRNRRDRAGEIMRKAADKIRQAEALETPAPATEPPAPVATALRTQADTVYVGRTPQELLEIAKPYEQNGPDYNRNIAESAARMRRALEMDRKFWQMNADELAVRLERWAAPAEPPSQEEKQAQNEETQILALTKAQEMILAQLPKAEAAEALKKGLGYDRPQTTTHRLPKDPLVYLDRQGEKKLGYIDQDGKPHMLTVEESAFKRQEIERFESEQKKRLGKRMEALRENARILDEQRIYQITPSGPAYYKKDGKWYERGSDRQLGRKKGDDLALQTLESANVGLYEVKVVSDGDTMYYQNVRQPAEAQASQEPAPAAGPASIGQENVNAKHSREWAEVSTEPTMSNPRGSLKTDAIRSKTPSAPWYYQGDIRQLAFNQKVIEGGKSAATPEGAQTLKEYSAAVKDGWSYTSVRAGSYGTVYVFRKDKQVLTNAGAAALTSEAMARPEGVPEARGGNETNAVSRLAQYSAKLMEWLQTLPESTLNSPVALSTKMRNDVLAKWVRLREPDHKPYEWQLRYLKPDGTTDVQFFAPSLEELIKTAINYAVIYRDMPASERDRAYHMVKAKDAPTVAEALAVNGFGPASQEPAAGPAEGVAAVTGYDSLREFINKLRDGEVTAEQVRTAWGQFKANRAAILADLNKMKVDDLLPMAGISARKADGKAAIAKSVVDMLESYFNPDGTISYSFGRNMQANKDAAMDEKVAKWTDEMIVDQARARREDAEARKAAREKALTNPETKDEWDRFVFAKGRQALTPEEIQAIKKMKSGRNEAVIRKGESLLTPEQLAAYDAVRGIDRKAAEQARTEAQARVYGVTAGVEADIVETKHTQKGHDLFVVKLSERVERPVYDRLNAAAKKLGGYYSSYSKGGAVPGFQFTSKAAAENFIAVSKGETVDQKEQIQERQEAKKSATASRLNALADGLDAKAEGILSADRKTNTVKRAREAAGQEANALKMQAMAQTMRNLAAAMESGEATHLDGVTAGTHVDTLDGMARAAMQRWSSAKNLGYTERQKAEAEGPTAEMMDAARIPYPYIDKSTILGMVEAGRKTPGAKLLAERVAKIQMNEDDGRAVTLRRDDDLENVKELAQKVYDRGRLFWDGIKWKYETYDRLKAMGLTNLPSLRAALREYLQYRGKAAKADPVKAMERELIGMKLPGFFPTPRPIIDEMIGLAGIRPGMTVLEPSAGKGDIAEAVQEAGAEVETFETQSRLRDILNAKGIYVRGHDFMDMQPREAFTFGDTFRAPDGYEGIMRGLGGMGSNRVRLVGPEGERASRYYSRSELTPVKKNGDGYDAVVMNPPFENGQDIEHVQHAYKFLKEGGTLVAVMSAGPFYRQDKQATAFREWLDEQNSTYEAMPEGSFAGADAFRQTGVRTYLVTIRKPYSSMPKMADEGQAGPGLAMPPAGQAVTPGQDAEYIAAVKAGDMKKAQRMVDEAADAYLKAMRNRWQKEGVSSFASVKNGDITLSEIQIPKEQRGKGIGTAKMQELIKFAQSQRMRVLLSPSTDFGASSKGRLEKFYGGFGFERNVGRNKDYRTRETMIWRPNGYDHSAWNSVTRDESGNVIPLSQRFSPASPSILHAPPGDQSADLEAAARAAMGEAEAGQPATEAEDLAETARLMDEQQKQAEAEAKARKELRNDPANIAAVEASRAMAGRNLSKQFTDPAARSFYQALTAAREMLGGPETVVFEEVRKWAARQLEADPAGAIAYATELADNKTIPGVEGQAVLAAVIEALNREVAMTGDKNQRLLLARLGNYYLDLGTALAQGLGFRRDTVETPQDRWNKALRVVFGPAEKVRRRLRLAPTEAGKARRIAELEAQLANYQGSRRADIEAALAEAKRQETQESILEKEDAKNEKLKDQILGRMDLTERDLTLSPVDRYSLQAAILDLPQVREALDNYPDGRDIMRLAMRGFSDEHIAGSLGLNQDDVAKFIKDATAAIIRPAVKAEVQAGRGFGDMVKSGLQALARKVGLRMAAVSGPLGTMSPPLSAADLAKIEQEVDDILNFALQPAARRNKAGRLISKVIDTPGGKKVRVFVPFDPDDAASFYAFAREFSTAKSGFFDKLYEYWINWPLLGGPQTQVANITGNAAQLAWHYTGQRLAEAALNVAYRDPNSAQLSEFKHIATAFFRSMGPALDMARQSFLTEGDTVRHKYLNEPMEIEFKDGNLDKLGAYRPAIGGKAGRLARLPGRLLRFADAFFKTAILHTEAAALAYRKAHAKAKAQSLTGANRAAFIDTEMANDMNNQGSDVWVKAMDTAEELLFQDENAATDLVDAMLGGHRSVRDLEKLKAEAEAKGDYEAAARISNRIFWRSVWGKIMRLIFPFQRTPTNIIKAGLRKAGGAALAGAWHATRAGLLRYKDGKPFIESYTKAMQIKDLSESLLAGLGWLALSSMFEGDDDDEEKPILIVGNRPYSPGNAGEREAFGRQSGGANAILFRDKDGKTIGTFNFSRYEPVATLLSAWVDGYRNFREVNRRRSQGEPDASYLTYIGSSLFASIEGKSFLQGVSGVMDTIRSFEERREPSTANWAAKQLINAAIPNIIKQPLRNWDDLVRETKTAGIGYTALPNPEVAPKTPFFQAQPKVTTTGEQIKKGYTGPARLLFQANAVVKPQPDALLLRANRLNPTAAWFPQPLQKDDFYVRAPGSKPGTPGYKSPITDPAKQRQFAELSGKLYAEAARQIEAKTPPAEKAKPTPGLIEAYKKARTEANAKARLMGGIRGLHKTATPAITTSNK